MKINVVKSYEKMSIKAADIFCEELKKKSQGVFGFATGSTPLGLYKELIKRYQKGDIDFINVTTFNLDEYFPIKGTNEQSYRYFMENELFDHINVKKDNIHIPNGESSYPILECKNYERKIEESNGIDLQILGIGENGHIGFNEPSHTFTKETNFTELTSSTIEANSRFFDNIKDVPTHALTMGIETIMKAKKILLLVNGRKKAEILYKALYGDITPEVPASILQRHPNVEVVADAEAGKLILKKD